MPGYPDRNVMIADSLCFSFQKPPGEQFMVVFHLAWRKVHLVYDTIKPDFVKESDPKLPFSFFLVRR